MEAPRELIKMARLWFVASPYTHYFRGIYGAFVDVSRIAGEVAVKYKVTVLSPICNGHPMATHGPLRARDEAFWRKFNQPLVEAAGGCLVIKMDGWETSKGVRGEINDFRSAKKMVVFVDPVSLELS